MLPRPDAQSFTKFLISAGALMLLAGFVIPGLILRETATLRVTRRTLAELTPLARRELERRQKIEREAGRAAPYISLGLLAGGFLVIGLGVPRLKRQESADTERASVELYKLRSELEPQTTEEHEARLAHEVKEEIAPEYEMAASEMPAGVTRAPTASPFRLSRAQLDAALEAEERVLARVAELAPPMYRFEAQVKISQRSSNDIAWGSTLFDGVLLSQARGRPDIVVEIKSMRRETFRPNLRKRIDDAIARLTRYRARVQPNATMWLIVVLAAPVTGRDREMADAWAREFSGMIAVTLTTLDDLDSLALPAYLISSSTPSWPVSSGAAENGGMSLELDERGVS